MALSAGSARFGQQIVQIAVITRPQKCGPSEEGPLLAYQLYFSMRLLLAEAIEQF